MHCDKCRKEAGSSPVKSNFLASLFAIAGGVVLFLNFNPEPVGIDYAGEEMETVDLAEFTSFASSGFAPSGSLLAKSVQAEEIVRKPRPVQTAMLPEPMQASPGTVIKPVPVQETVGVEVSGQADADVVHACTGEEAIHLTQKALEQGLQRLEHIPDYTSTFIKQERVAGKLGEPGLINLKIRHQPFSIYMKWYNGDKGRELLDVDGQNKGDLVVRVGGIRGRFLPALNLNPYGDLAMKESRHPVTEIGIKNLVKKALAFRQKDLKNLDNLQCQVIDQVSFDKRDCFEFIVEYIEQRPVHVYRKSVLTVDKEYSLPIAVKNFAWPNEVDNYDEKQIDQSTLVENYAYTNFSCARRLADMDFSKNNKKYRFKK